MFSNVLLTFANLCCLFYYLIMKKKSSIKKFKRIGLRSSVSVYKTNFSITKNIKFSNTNKIANHLARAFKNFKVLKF